VAAGSAAAIDLAPLQASFGVRWTPTFSEGTVLDEFIERWSGYTLIIIGVVAIAASAAGYFYLLPPPFSMRPELAHVIVIGGSKRWTIMSQMLGYGGLFCLWGGGYTIAYFRQDWRAENTTSHLTSAEAVKGAAERLWLRRKL
jgi:hypothetical protein